MMRLIAIDGPEPKRVRPSREAEIYALLHRHPELFEKGTLFRLLSVNVQTEKGPDFLAVNRKGHLIIGEIKRGGLHLGALAQAKYYAKRLGRMREAELNNYLARRADTRFLRDLTRGFLGPTARAAFFNPSRRKVQLLLVAEDFPDLVLRNATRSKLGKRLREFVKDIKCVQIRTYRVRARSTLAIASVVSGWRRRLRK